MKFKNVIEKLSNLTEIILLPSGLKLKLKHKNFHWREYRMCLRIRSCGVHPKCIFDVGANEGNFAIAAREVFPKARLILYEPGNSAFARLQKALGEMSRIELYNKALGSELGEANLRVTNADQSSSLLELGRAHLEAFPEIFEVKQETVSVTTFEREFQRIFPESPILLKIDTQGFEMQVLQGAGLSLGLVDWIVLEASSQPMYKGEVIFLEIAKWLEERGFQFIGPIELNFDSTRRPCQFDALFTRAINSGAQ
jgi:FkbM family methyltransferase